MYFDDDLLTGKYSPPPGGEVFIFVEWMGYSHSVHVKKRTIDSIEESLEDVRGRIERGEPFLKNG
jgi:hypothetical protein